MNNHQDQVSVRGKIVKVEVKEKREWKWFPGADSYLSTRGSRTQIFTESTLLFIIILIKFIRNIKF